MKVYLMRHGRTAYNQAHRYQGQSDIPLSPDGEGALRPAGMTPERVYVSPLGRARRTAQLIFPGSAQVVVDDLREMDFGVFEGRTYKEMKGDPDYRGWVDGGCEGRCPGGESRTEFSDRVCAAFLSLLTDSLAAGAEELAIVAHGGVQMSVLERFATPERAYFLWQADCGCGYVLDVPSDWREGTRLTVTGQLRCAEEG